MNVFFLSDPKLHDKIAETFGYKPGVYQLHYQSGSEKFKNIARLVGADPNGILYIGASVSLPYRIGSLKKSVSAAYRRDGYTDPKAHQCGKNRSESCI